MLFLELDLDPGPVLEEMRSQDLLTPVEAAELSTWFKASCHSPEPLELPEPLYRALMQAIALRQLDPEQATRH